MTQNSTETFQNNRDQIEADENENQKLLELLNVDVLQRGSLDKILALLSREPELLEPGTKAQEINLKLANKELESLHLRTRKLIETLPADNITDERKEEVLLEIARYVYAYNKYYVNWERPDKVIEVPSGLLKLITQDDLKTEFHQEKYKKFHGLHKPMTIEEDMVPDWEHSISHLLKGPELVVMKTPEQQIEWKGEFDAIIAKRGEVAGLLQSAIEARDKVVTLDSDAKEQILRDFAEYLDLLNKYHKKWNAEHRLIELPEFLAEYVKTDVRRNTAVTTTTRILAYQHHLGENDDRVDRIASDSGNLLIRMVGKNLRLKYCIIPCLEDDKPKQEDQPYISVIEEIGYEPTQENIKALRLIVAYISEHLKSIDDFVKNGDSSDRGEVRLYQALEQSSFLPGMQNATDGLSKVIADKSTEFIQDGKIITLSPGQVPDLSEITLSFSIDNIPPALRVQIDGEILRAIASNKKYKHLSETELRGHLEIVLEYLYTTEPDIPLKDRKVNYGELEQVEKDIIELMLQGVSCDSTVATLRSSLLIDEDTDDKWQQRAIKAFKDMLDPDEGSLKNKDIANLYYLLRLSQQSENKPGPNLVLALKSLSLLRQKHENGKIVINLEAQLLNRIIAIFIDTAADAEGLVKALDKIKIPPEHQRTIKDVGETIRLKTADAVQEAIDRSLAQAANNPLLVLAGVITWGGPTAVALGLVGRGVTYKLNAGRLHKFYTYPIEGAEDLSKFRKIFKLDDSISISQIKNARIEAETIYDSITKLQTRFDILERGRLNKRGNALLSSMKKAEFERYGKRIRKLFPKSPNSAANVLMNFEPDPVKLRSVLLKSGYTAEQAKAGVKPIYLETLAERSASLARRVEEIEALPGKDRAARWKSFIDEEVRPFQRSLTEFGAEYGSEEARRMAAGRVQGIELGEGDDIWRLIQEAHSLDDVPEKFLKLLGEDFNTLSEAAKTQRIQAAKRLMRLGIVGDAPTAAVLERLATRAAPAMETMSASERLLSLRLPNTPTTRAFLEGSEGAKYYRQLAEIVEESGEAGGRRALRYLTNLPETASPAARSAEVLRLVSKMDDPLLASRTLGSLPRASSLTSAECVSAIDQLVRTGGRSVLSRAASAAGFFAVDLLFAGLEFKQAVDEIERLKQAREEAIKALDELCKAGFLKSVESGVYEGQGVVIAIDEVMDTQNTDVGRHITHGAMILGEGAAFTTLWLTSTFTGPGMIIAIPVLIGVHAGIDHIADEIGKDKRRDFINACPTWLLALLGSARAVGRNEYQIVQECEESTPPQAMVMANSPSAAGTAHQMYVEVEAEKKVSREKSFQALCFRELSFLGRSELMAYLPGGGDPRELFKPEAEFLQEDGDYWNIVRQFARLQIHAESRQDTSGDSIPLVPFEKTEKLDITDYRGSWFSDNYRPLITPQEFGDIARTSMLFYVHHRRELMYRKTIEAIQERFAGDEEYMKFEIEEFHKDIQKYPDLYYVFNMHPKDLPAWNGKTVAKQILEEKLQEMSSPERVPPTADVAATGYGIPGGEKYDLETFLSRHVEVHASSSVRVRLEQYENTHEGLPIKMVEMEQWGEDEEFFSTLKQKLQPLHDLNRELFASMHNQADLEAFVNKHKKTFELYLALVPHNDFYHDYALFRGETVHIPADYSTWVQPLADWAEQGLTTSLFDEKVFQDQQKGADQLVYNSGSEKTDWWRKKPESRKLPLLPESMRLAGYNPDKKGQILFTLDGYYSAGYRNTQERPPYRMNDPLNVGKERDALMDYVLRQQSKPSEEPKLRVSGMDTELQDVVPKVIDRYGAQKFIDVDNIGDAIAVPAQHLDEFIRQWKKNDGMDTLRWEILKRRVYVVVDISSEIARGGE